jgi:hypothetical protein
MRRLLISGSLVLAAAFAVLMVAGELVLRAFGFSSPTWYQPDATLGWAMRPGARGWFTREGRAWSEVNAAGFRDRSHTLEKPAGAFRIAVLGDSVVEAFQVDLKEAFWWQLGEKLRGCPALAGREPEMLAFGVSGYGTAQAYLLLESTAARYRPDLVLLAFAPNDVRNNSARLEPENERPFFVPDGEGLRLDASFAGKPAFVRRSSVLHQAYRAASDRLLMVQLVQAARHGLDIRRQVGTAHAAASTLPGIEPMTIVSLFAPPREPAWEEAWTVTERLIARMNAAAARAGARFAVAVLTHSAQLNPDAATRRNLEGALGVQDLFYIERRLEALGEREGVPVVSLAPPMQRLADETRTYFHGFENYRVGWGHWNARGHRAAAAILAPRLCAAL